MYIVLKTNIPSYDSLIEEYRVIHAANADNAQLSIAPLKNGRVLIKVNGLTDDKIGATPDEKFGKTGAERLDFYKLNRLIEGEE